jgi:hypothetical protein
LTRIGGAPRVAAGAEHLGRVAAEANREGVADH